MLEVSGIPWMYETIGTYKPAGLGYLEIKNESESCEWQSEITVFEKAGDCPSPLSAHTASYTAVGAALSQLLKPLVFRVYLKAHRDHTRLQAAGSRFNSSKSTVSTENVVNSNFMPSYSHS